MNRYTRGLIPQSVLAVVLLVAATPFVSEGAAPLAPGSPPQSENAPVEILKGRSSITRTSDPLWVSAETATTPDGEVDWALLGERARTLSEGVADQPPLPVDLVDEMPEASGVFYETADDGETITWLRFGPGSLEDPGGHLETLRQVAETARGIYVGEVVGIEEGFLLGEPGSLLRIRTERVVLSSDEHRISEEFYLFWPEAKFQIGDLHFWKENSVYPDRPAAGSRVLVVADRRVPFDAARKLILPRSEGVFVEPAKGGLRVSDRAAVPSGATAPSTLEEVPAELQRLVEQGGGREEARSARLKRIDRASGAPRRPRRLRGGGGVQVSVGEIAWRAPHGELVVPQTLKGDESTGKPTSWQGRIERVHRAFSRQLLRRESSTGPAGEEGS